MKWIVSLAALACLALAGLDAQDASYQWSTTTVNDCVNLRCNGTVVGWLNLKSGEYHSFAAQDRVVPPPISLPDMEKKYSFYQIPGKYSEADLKAAVPCCGQQFIQAKFVQDGDGKRELTPLPKRTDVPAKAKYGRGMKLPSPAVRAVYHAKAFARHGHRVKSLPKATAPAWDCRTLGYVLPVDNQGNCGDCYGVSAADGCSMALGKAGQLPNDTSKGRLSSQYGLDNPDAFQGGCDGGWPAQVIDYIKTYGFPLTSDYGPYTASPGENHLKAGTRLWKIADWGFCTPSQEQGVASTQDMKNCIAQYGPISVAVDTSEFDAYQWPQAMRGNGDNVDHAILCIGWDDSKQAFLGMNQWGESWGGPGGTFWIGYGADSFGTSAVFMTASTLPPPPVPPTPPTPPTPPVPPLPGVVTVTLTPMQVQSIATQAGLVPAGTVPNIPPGSVVLSPATVQQLLQDLQAAAQKAKDKK